MENLSTEEKEQLLALIKKANEPKSKAWKPESEERFWAIDVTGRPYELANRVQAHTNNMVSIGNCFRTQAEAVFMVERLIVLQELSKLANGHQYKYKACNYFLYYSHDYNEIKIAYHYEIKRNDIYFATREEAEAAIKAVGEDRIKKYYFCV